MINQRTLLLLVLTCQKLQTEQNYKSKSFFRDVVSHSNITNARQKEIRSGAHVNHDYSNEFLDSDRTANVYFTSDVKLEV